MFLSKIFNKIDHPYMEGRGGRKQNNQRMQGMTIGSLKHHFGIVPLFVIMSGGISFISWYLYRLATKGAHINWRKTSWEECNNFYANKQVKKFNPKGIDYSMESEKRRVPNYQHQDQQD